ncbi:MAG: hypothetical protein ABJH44_00190, partial [Balneola sp.]
LFVVFMIGLYFWYFNQGISTDINRWGITGSFFGGIIGTLLAFITTILLIYSNAKQHSDLKYERDLKAFFELFKYRKSIINESLNLRIDSTYDKIIEFSENDPLELKQWQEIVNNSILELKKNYFEKIHDIINIDLYLITLLNKLEEDNFLKSFFLSQLTEKEKFNLVFYFLYLESDTEKSKTIENYFNCLGIKRNSFGMYNNKPKE